MHFSEYLRHGLPDEQPRAECPSCGFEAHIDGFAVLGAEEGNIFCNACGEEFPWSPDKTRHKIQQTLF
jgi:hypothetical protein